jgi:cyclopropane fatty-acyl-phospholipid synthase-like methyltransferase
VLRACARVLKPGGRIGYFVITDTEDLSATEAAKLLETGSGPAGSGDVYASLMARTGFDEVDVTDVTADYETTLAGWIREWDAERSAIERLTGREAFDERRAKRLEDLDAIRSGHRHRYLISATRS